MTDTPTQPPPSTQRLAPQPAAGRIEALDVVRGFALIGICLMNVEFFNRPVVEAGSGMQPGLTGIDWLAGFFVAYFVAGKFWTIFALLFGMGFALMLTRAEVAGRPFLRPYLRRIGALAVFGVLHELFIWGGDILFSYAVGALFLLLALFGTWRWMAAALAASLALIAFPAAEALGGAAVIALAASAITALYLRDETGSLGLAGLLLGGLLLAAAAFTVAAGSGRHAAELAAAGAVVLLIAFLATKYQNPPHARAWRAGVALYTLVFTLVGAIGALEHFAPATARAGPDSMVLERASRSAEEQRVLTRGSYGDAVKVRANHFAALIPDEVGAAPLVVGMFLLGTWFIRSGVMRDTGAHLPLFRKLALIGLPLGIGLGLLGIPMATAPQPGVFDAGFQLASALLSLGGLAASVGYLGLVVLMLHGRRPLSAIRVLAPYGRMALSNYLMQSLICALVFFGYGLGYWGLGRAWQLVFALVLCAGQIVLSHWWLRRYRYGPLEWLWRAITYLEWPVMRVGQHPAPRKTR